jgi:anthranilate synthase/indole-3-glycerol phosphate synthase/phosphoribosylanthranilate isomerase
MGKILMIDNYDSFTYNLYQYLSELGANVVVARNDQITLKQCQDLKPDRVVISPGPGNPDESGVSLEVIKHFQGKVPILGVCLGHQALYQVYGGTVDVANEIWHGKTSPIHHDGKG